MKTLNWIFENLTIPVLLLTFIVFLVLRLTHVIMWSWWFVTMPISIPLAIIIGILAFMGLSLMSGNLYNF